MRVKTLLKRLEDDRNRALLSAYEFYAEGMMNLTRNQDKAELCKQYGDQQAEEVRRLEITINEIEKRVS